jgi:hypothetical protein
MTSPEWLRYSERMNRRPQESEAAPYYFTYINQVGGDDILTTLENQVRESLPLLSSISEETSLYRYAPGKWSVREALNHINDAERMFAFRALWFARGFEDPLPSFDQNIAVSRAGANQISWTTHIEEFQRVRSATIALFRNLPPEAWSRSGTASGNHFTVRAMAYIAAGHLTHHAAVLREKYLKNS